MIPPAIDALWPVVLWLGISSLKSLVAVALILLARRLLQHWLSAQLRYALWLALPMVLFLPAGIPVDVGAGQGVLQRVVGSVKAVVPAAAGIATTEVPVEAEVSPLPSVAGSGPGALETVGGEAINALVPGPAGQPVPLQSTQEGRIDPVRKGLTLAWLAGSALFALLVAWRLLQQLAIARRAARASPGADALLRDVCSGFGMNRRVDLRQSPMVESPVVFGLFRPVILLPADLAGQMSLQDLRHVFLHELSHVRRHDVWVNLLAGCVQAAYWFNPAVWLALRLLRNDMEQACDAAAVAHLSTDERRAYGSTLLQLTDPSPVLLPAVGRLGIAENRAQLTERISRLMSLRRGSALQVAAIAGLMTLITLAGTLRAADRLEPARVQAAVEPATPAPIPAPSVPVQVVPAAAASATAIQPPAPASPVSAGLPSAQAWQVVRDHCVACHNGQTTAGGLNLDELVGSDLTANRAIWEHSIERLVAGHSRSARVVGLPVPTGLSSTPLTPASGVALQRWMEAQLDADLDTSDALQEGTPISGRSLAGHLTGLLVRGSFQTPSELHALADSGRLQEPAVLADQVHRMLAQQGARSMVNVFAQQWLKLANLDLIASDPEWSGSGNNYFTSRAMLKDEIILWVTSVLLSDQSILRLLDSDYTYVNEWLAGFYGIDGVTGEQFRRVRLQDPDRFGLLGKGAVLMNTSWVNRISPTMRGAWIFQKLLGVEPPPPPPNVESMFSDYLDQPGTSQRVLWERFVEPRTCRSCHDVLDGLSFPLGHFDWAGRTQLLDPNTGEPSDTSGALPNGIEVNGARELSQGLLRHYSQDFVTGFVKQFLEFNLGREINAEDMPSIRKIVRDSAADNYTFEAILQNIVVSRVWRYRG